MRNKLKAIDANFSEEVRNAITAERFFVNIKNSDDGIELLIFDEIGENPFTGGGVSPKEVAAVLASNRGKPVNVRLNSPGGFVWDGVSIYNSLIQHDAQVTTTIEGVAASAASLIFQAGDVRRMFDNSTQMTHRSTGIAIGNVDVMQEVSDVLSKLDDQLAATYAARSGRQKATIMALMIGKGKSDGTYFTAQEAVDAGLADEVIPLKKKNRVKNSDEVPLVPDEKTDVTTPTERFDATMKSERRLKLARAAKARLRLMEIGAGG